mgnify:CR=1 FL=1
MEKVALLIMVLMITLTGEVIAQDYKKIKKLVDKEHYQQAWQLIEQELQVNSEDQKINYYAGVTKLELYQQQEALSYLLKSVNDRYHFYLAKAYFENDLLEEAKQAASSIKRSSLSVKETYLITEQFVSYEKLRASPKHVVVKNLGSKINSDSHEYNGVMTKDQKSVLYTVRKTGSNQVAGDGLAYDKIY